MILICQVIVLGPIQTNLITNIIVNVHWVYELKCSGCSYF